MLTTAIPNNGLYLYRTVRSTM